MKKTHIGKSCKKVSPCFWITFLLFEIFQVTFEISNENTKTFIKQKYFLKYVRHYFFQWLF